MARITKPLTNTEIKQAKPRDNEYSLADGRGLSLRVKPNGSRLWIFNYTRPYSKKRANMSFGSYPALSLAQARKLRDTANEQLAEKTDPSERRKELALSQQLAQNNTLIAISAMWFEIKRNQVSPEYADDIWRSLNLHVFPGLGKVPIHKVKASKTIEILRPLEASGRQETVKRVCQRVNEIMVYAVNYGLIDANPLAGISKAFLPPQKKHLPTIRPDELPDLMATLSIASIKLVTRYLIEWQLHTMIRPGEAACARWQEIDLEEKLWRIPAATMKKKRPHVVPLSPSAVALLDALRPISGHRQFIFPGYRNPRNNINKSTANVALKRMGYGGRLVAHGLRSIASTALNEEGFDRDVIEAALAHVDDNEVRKAYNRSEYLERRRPMMHWWSAYIEKAATGTVSLSGNAGVLRVVN